VGCEISVCSPHSGMPIKVSNIKALNTTWQYHPGYSWKGDAAYDIWFDPTPRTSDQIDKGAEIMIWLGTSGVGRPTGRTMRIDGTRWAYTTWRATRPDGRSWNYIRFWRVRPTLSVRKLDLKPFLAYAQHVHKLSSTWWLTSVEAGFELWRGGLGMTSLNYEVSLMPWRTAAKPKPTARPVARDRKPKPDVLKPIHRGRCH
jgi:hypothetical protein